MNEFTDLDRTKKVCIIVPVYNAEKYLGYCLNSIVSQSYTNWTAILVNDGSTDSSLQICRQYAKVDPRFQVIDIPNGGVSHARNVGLQTAEGDYLAFLDSDDLLAPDALETQVAAAQQYGKQLIVSDSLMLDFSNPDGKKVKLNAGWLEDKPCVLGRKEFKEKEMRIIWLTALMECCWGKLFDLALWKEQKITFPEDLSLGEDFITTLNYYNACNGAVFLQQVGHYYNCIPNSSSLTQKYRPDLFEVKMFLMEQLQKHLGDIDSLSSEERNAFFCYVAGSGLFCAERIAREASLTKEQKLSRLEQIFSHPLFTRSLGEASYIPEQYQACMPAIGRKRYRSVLRILSRKEAAPAVSEKPVYLQGPLNRAIRRMMRQLRPLFGQSAMGERLERWEQEFEQSGLKNTIRAHRASKKKVNTYQLEVQTQRLEEQIRSLDKKQRETARAVSSTENSLNDLILFSERQIARENYLREINELRQRKKALMIATAEHSNIGDAAITLAEQYILGEQYPEYYQVEISTYEYARREKFLHAIINPQDIIFLNGGGNIGDMYPAEEELHRRIISEFPGNKIVILPQTISFSATDAGRRELDISAEIYNSHPDLTLFVRGQKNYELAREYFPQVRKYIMPDTVHVLSTRYAFPRQGALLCLRTDGEAWLTAEKKAAIPDTAAKLCGSVEYRTNMYEEDITREIRGYVVRNELMRYAKSRVVITDRLHGMIFSAITGTPCVVLSTFNHKLSDYYDTFFKGSNAIFFIEKDIDRLESAIKQALEVKNPEYPALEGRSFVSLRDLRCKSCDNPQSD